MEKIKRFSFYLLLIGIVALFVVVLTTFGKSFSYKVFYEDMVRQTICEMVKDVDCNDR